ncbi:unnamed protein product [Didymodactylos carnosus]|uniref:EXS domain-containing protein n=1 Tax=Didymodactylos carnosus TaxID=1234261 RepID=A0A815REH1_9BILA|nr:unnamed protein product [Didymodactylos carnosus]CAF1475697.1 unnamed protein product [Didymodactylos carnosus]CAF3954975.1 unnamed protein product [Didymodactylos carnosus]CAF4341890.1 unnamed protein product [Didymodactylos carnosus]
MKRLRVPPLEEKQSPLVTFRVGIFIVPILYRPARYWLLKTLGRIFSAAFHPIFFAEFWLANQLASLELAFFDLEYFFCFYTSDRQWWSTNLTSPASPKGAFCTGWSRFLLQAFLLAIPSSIRCAQCIRRYYDSKLKFPHLANAGKYSTSILVAITNSLRRATNILSYPGKPKKNPFVYTWITAALISSTYKLIWDLKMDWGLFHKNAGENKFLRNHLVYSSKIYYYYAIIQDIILRYLWTINIFVQFTTGTAEYSDVIGFSFGLVEVLRRFLWNFFRLENEHLNNCGQFRAVRDISIAPIKTGINFSLIHSKLSNEPGIRSRRSKIPFSTIVEEENIATSDDTTIDILKNSAADLVDNMVSACDTTVVQNVNEINTTLSDIRAKTRHTFSVLDDDLNSSNSVLRVDHLNILLKRSLSV